MTTLRKDVLLAYVADLVREARQETVDRLIALYQRGCGQDPKDQDTDPDSFVAAASALPLDPEPAQPEAVCPTCKKKS